MKAVIFDFDGTLGDTQQGILATAQEVIDYQRWKESLLGKSLD